MRNDVRKKLLADYAVALVAERESWGRLHEPDLTEAERCRILGEWKQVSAGLKTLVRQLREVPGAGTPVAARSAGPSPAVPLAPAGANDEAPAATAAVTAPLAPAAGAQGQPFRAHCVVASLRLVTALRARLQTAVPRLGPL